MSSYSDTDLLSHFSSLLNAFQNEPLQKQQAIKAWCVAFSGGLDSRVLLHLLLTSTSLPVRVIHIHHGVSDFADDWESFCRETALAYEVGIEFISKRVAVDSSGSFEEKARQARYQVFEDLLGENEVLLMGHHLNDQVETFFQRLVRGAGLSGLAGMPKSRPLGKGQLLRPLLEVPRASLLKYAQEHELSWVEDESNDSLNYDRNYIRHKIAPVFLSRWPSAFTSIARSLSVARQDSESLSFYRDQWLVVNRSLTELNLAVFGELPRTEQLGLLSHWVRKRTGHSLSYDQLTSLLNDVVMSQQDAQAVLRAGAFEFRRYQQALYVLLVADTEFDGSWSQEITLQPGQVHIERLPDGSCLRLEPDDQGVVFPQNRCRIGYRQGGERFKPVGDHHTRELKKWLQAQGVAPWLRSQIPLLYCNQQLVAVADLAVDQAFLCQSGQMGWKVIWQR